MQTVMVSAPFSVFMTPNEKDGFDFDIGAKRQVLKVLEIVKNSRNILLSSHISDSFGEKVWVENFVERDFGWIEQCDTMVVFLPSNSNGEIIRSDGTMIELGYARALEKKIIFLHHAYEDERNSFFIRDLINNSTSILCKEGWEEKLSEMLNQKTEVQVPTSEREQTTDVDDMLDRLRKISSSHEVEIAGIPLTILPGVLSPKYSHAPDALMSVWKIPKTAKVLDIGSGSGVLGIAALKSGAGSLVALDINQQAIDNTNLNLKRLSLTNQGEARLSDGLTALKAGETFDTIILAAPYWDREAKDDLDKSCFDSKHSFLADVIKGASSRMTKEAHLYIIFSDQGDVGYASQLIQDSELKIADLHLMRPSQKNGHIRIIWDLTKA